MTTSQELNRKAALEIVRLFRTHCEILVNSETFDDQLIKATVAYALDQSVEELLSWVDLTDTVANNLQAMTDKAYQRVPVG